MIRDIISAVVEAEKKAEAIVAAAKADYKTTIADAELKAEELLAEGRRARRELAKQTQISAQSSTTAAAAARRADMQKKAKQEIEKYETRADGAVARILELLVQKWQS